MRVTSRRLIILCEMTGLFVFALCFILLILGYVFYGHLAAKVYGCHSSGEMPCIKMPDGVDYVPLPTWKVFMIQLLNIAGLGPVVGAVSGCLFGPVALLWIVLGCVFAGALHDFLAAMMSADRDGENLPELLGEHLGEPARHAMRVICIFMLLLVGVVFTLLPAGMLHAMFDSLSALQWSCVVLAYYFLATILPIGAIIGRIYPVFGLLFLFMAVGLGVMLPLGELPLLPDLNVFENMHPKGISVWPMLFVTIACGAISGFHATQSPMMVRCLRDRSHMRRVFYGAMVVEGMVALVWAAVGLTLREVVLEDTRTFEQLAAVNPSAAVHAACHYLLGGIGGGLAVMGVIVLAVTSGDTAMRSCRLMLADVIRVKQVSMGSRLLLAVPLFLAVIVISQVDFSILWRYFGWANQTLACITLWGISAFLRRSRRQCLMALLPAVFMTAMCTTFLLHAAECGINLPLLPASSVGIVVAVMLTLVFYRSVRPQAAENAAE